MDEKAKEKGFAHSCNEGTDAGECFDEEFDTAREESGRKWTDEEPEDDETTIRYSDVFDGAHRVHVLGPMITDHRLTDAQFRTLLWLTFRCADKGECFVSYRSLAEDRGVHVSTLHAHIKALRELGWIRIEGHGKAGVSTIKIIMSPRDIYPQELMEEFWDLLRRGRSSYEIELLRSEEDYD